MTTGESPARAHPGDRGRKQGSPATRTPGRGPPSYRDNTIDKVIIDLYETLGGVDHIVSGMAINILGFGLTQYLAAVAFEDVEGGGPTQSPPISPRVGTVTVPWLADAMGDVERKGWFLFSDIAGIVRGLTYQVSLLTVLAVALVLPDARLTPRTWWSGHDSGCG